MKLKLIVLLMLGIATGYSQTAKKKTTAAKPKTTAAKPAAKTPAAPDGIFATIETSKGNITLELDYKRTPVTVANFISLAEGTNTIVGDQFKGKRFYDGLKFHRVIANFMIQGGDPAGNGSGGPGYAFKDETSPDDKFDKPGILAMANAGPATNGSQFFITHKDTPWLNGKHTIFGRVTSGQDVVDAIAQDDVINKITIKRNGAEAKAFDAAKVFADDYHLMEKIKETARKQKEELAAKDKQEYLDKYGQIMLDKVAEFNAARKTATKTESGLQYKILRKGKGPKPAQGTTIYFHYAGYFEDGKMFDSSYENVNKLYGRHDANNPYNPFPFRLGDKNMIAGFLEALSLMNYGDKIIIFVPANLGYGAAGRPPVIPGNTNLIFELEMFEKMPEKK